MSRNVFESGVPTAELADVEDEVFMILPPLPAGESYELKTLSSGRVVVVVKQG